MSIDWTQVKTAEQKAAEALEQSQTQARTNRDHLLTTSDWRVTKAYEQGVALDTEWADYRQALRDVPQQTGFPSDIVWPSEPVKGDQQ